MVRTLFVAALALGVAAPAYADFVPINDRDTFLRVVDGRELRLGVFQIALTITPDGQINGSALGWDVAGTWSWEDGYFCREIDWSGKAIPYNCQLVEVQDDAKIRFTVDKGAGDEATFNLR
ncbi:MAG: dihydrodipicolinate reductase [Rhodobacteraceae bacterium]|jgi:hypothetical protein|nr:dihydrodipicolinate reductase [Paracoccaceae bacterium]